MLIPVGVAPYTTYFQQIAINNAHLQHNPAGETGDAPVESLRFTRWGAEEAVTGLRTKIGFPALLLELYENKVSSEMQLDVKNNYTGAFTILATANRGNFVSEINAYGLAEQIMYEVLNTIWNDHYGEGTERCLTPFEIFDFNSLNIIPVGPLFDNQFGYRCEFSFQMRTAGGPGSASFVPYPNDYYTKQEIDEKLSVMIRVE
jgi:hypothetical protein